MSRCSAWLRHTVIATVAVVFAFAPYLRAEQGRIVLPRIEGREGLQVFAGHPGWVDVYHKGYCKTVSARIQPDGSFELSKPDKPVSLIAMFDRNETPPVILPQWPVEPDNFDVPIAVEYACVPDGYPEVWDKEYKKKGTDFFQTFVPQCTQLYGFSVFDGPRQEKHGNRVMVSVHPDGPDSKALLFKDKGSPDPGWVGHWDELTAWDSDRELPYVGWRHGDMPIEAGRTHAIRAGGYRTHGARRLKQVVYVRPDKGDGYAKGNAFADGLALDGDLCCLIFGNSHGQIVENQIRSLQWEVFLPRHRPTTQWGQTFVSHGHSLAGVSFWASAGSASSVLCEVLILEEGPWGRKLGQAKIARGHESPDRPVVVYPDTPAAMPEYTEFYKRPSRFFQVAYAPDEIKLKPGKTYYVQLMPSRPLMMYVDGDRYQQGYAFYEGLKVDRQRDGVMTKHSKRWTLAMNIVTYANPGGKPLSK